MACLICAYNYNKRACRVVYIIMCLCKYLVYSKLVHLGAHVQGTIATSVSE